MLFSGFGYYCRFAIIWTLFGAMKTSYIWSNENEQKEMKKLIEYQKLSTIPPVLLNVNEIFYTNVVNEKLQMDISDHNMLCCHAL